MKFACGTHALVSIHDVCINNPDIGKSPRVISGYIAFLFINVNVMVAIGGVKKLICNIQNLIRAIVVSIINTNDFGQCSPAF